MIAGILSSPHTPQWKTESVQFIYTAPSHKRSSLGAKSCGDTTKNTSLSRPPCPLTPPACHIQLQTPSFVWGGGGLNAHARAHTDPHTHTQTNLSWSGCVNVAMTHRPGVVNKRAALSGAAEMDNKDIKNQLVSMRADTLSKYLSGKRSQREKRMRRCSPRPRLGSNNL